MGGGVFAVVFATWALATCGFTAGGFGGVLRATAFGALGGGALTGGFLTGAAREATAVGAAPTCGRALP